MNVPPGTKFFEVEGLPVADVPSDKGWTALNCSFDPPRPLSNQLALETESEISREELDLLVSSSRPAS
jgi:hypothetical protein